jgi:hypothetical protein
LSGQALAGTPVSVDIRPVYQLALAGQHWGIVVYISIKDVPSLTMRSIAGVFT